MVDYDTYDWDGPGAGRRSVYRFLFRTLPDPFLDTLDAADASQLTAVRNESVTPLQALALLNNRFVLRHAEHLAAGSRRRPATLDEPDRRRVRADARPAARRPTSCATGRPTPTRHGLANACRLLFNSNEFLFVN